VKSRDAERESVGVPETAKQADEVRDRWSWVERRVWTERMLTALEDGVKGGKWFALIDKVYAPRNLRAAFERVKANGGSGGVDHVTVERFEGRLDEEINALSRSLRENRFRPQRIKRTWIPKPGTSEKRPLGVPTVRDRVVQTALRNVLEPIFERDFATHSYGFRPERSCKDALRRVDALLKAGFTHVVDADLKNYFDTIPWGPLLARVEEKIADGRVLRLVRQYLEQGIMEGPKTWTPESGSPQGAVISPLLSNIYLDPLDHQMEALGIEMVRYADDLVLLCRTEAEAVGALDTLRKWTTEAGLTLHPEKTRIVDVREPGGFDFLGYHFEQGQRWPREKSRKKLKDAIRAKTRRANGRSLNAIIVDVNRTLCGWFEYFQHSHRYTFTSLDGWVRMRLRSILREREGRSGPGRGFDHQRWPNRFFAERGLFSMSTAWARLRQSPPG
jgi:RNA-directed DNA polymerase